MFWMNGLNVDLDTLELFTFVRKLPEPVPTEMVLWDSPTSALAGTGSEWSVTLKGHLLALLAAIYEHHETILSCEGYNGFESSPRQRISHLNSYCLKIKQLIGLTELSALSVWTSEDEGVEESVAHYNLVSEPTFLRVMELPHIRKILKDDEAKMRDLQRLARRCEVGFNKTMKRLKSVPTT